MSRIVLNPFGSLGDLNPYLGLALGLKARGHTPVVASSRAYQEKIEREGIAFAPVRPDVSDFLDRPDWNRKLFDRRTGTEFLFRDYLIPRTRGAFSDLYPVADGADLLITHMAALAGPLVAEARRIPFLSISLQPSALFSAIDLMVLPQAEPLRHLYPLGLWFRRALLNMGEWQTQRWARPIADLRRELGLAPPNRSPVMTGQFSPYGTLALFSRHFAPRQPDWPPHTTQTGFLFYDKSGVPALEEPQANELASFLLAGKPPVLFTLGSSAVAEAGNFFEESVDAVQKLGIRAIFLVGAANLSSWSERRPSTTNILVTSYLPYSEIMPRCAAVVHSGGIGTTAQALRAACPALVVPWSNDQPDNAQRIARLAAGRVLARHHYTAVRAASELKQLLSDAAIRSRVGAIAAAISEEQPLQSACDAVETVLRKGASHVTWREHG